MRFVCIYEQFYVTLRLIIEIEAPKTHTGNWYLFRFGAGIPIGGEPGRDSLLSGQGCALTNKGLKYEKECFLSFFSFIILPCQKFFVSLR